MNTLNWAVTRTRRVLFRVEEEKWPEYHVFKAIYAMRTGLMLPRVAFLKLLSSGDDAIVIVSLHVEKLNVLKACNFVERVRERDEVQVHFFRANFRRSLHGCNLAISLNLPVRCQSKMLNNQSNCILISISKMLLSVTTPTVPIVLVYGIHSVWLL